MSQNDHITITKSKVLIIASKPVDIVHQLSNCTIIPFTMYLSMCMCNMCPVVIHTYSNINIIWPNLKYIKFLNAWIVLKSGVIS